MTNKKVIFNNYTCTLQFAQYSNGRTAIELLDDKDGEPVATATVNLPNVPLAHDHVMIKNYSENDGMLKTLMDAGIISEPVNIVASGYILVPIVKLLVKPE